MGDDFPRADSFGGTDEIVQWRATLKPDGSFNAIWNKPHSGALVTRRPQNYPMKWYADCDPGEALPLYPERANALEYDGFGFALDVKCLKIAPEQIKYERLKVAPSKPLT